MSTETSTGTPLAWIPVRNRGSNYEVAVTAAVGGLNDREAVATWCADARPVGAWRPVALVEAEHLDQVEAARRWAVRLEQDAAEGRRAAAAFVEAWSTPADWGETQHAVADLRAWIDAGDEVAR